MPNGICCVHILNTQHTLHASYTPRCSLLVRTQNAERHKCTSTDRRKEKKRNDCGFYYVFTNLFVNYLTPVIFYITLFVFYFIFFTLFVNLVQCFYRLFLPTDIDRRFVVDIILIFVCLFISNNIFFSFIFFVVVFSSASFFLILFFYHRHRLSVACTYTWHLCAPVSLALCVSLVVINQI